MSDDRARPTFPAAPSDTPGWPSNPLPITFDAFETLQTKSLRPAIKDGEMAICDGWMPLGPSNLRTLYGVGTPLFTAAAGLTIAFFGFGNCGATATAQHQGIPVAIILQSDGSLVQVNTNTGVQTPMAPAGTVTGTSVGMAQFGNQFIILVANQTNGYFLWDGVNFYDAGTIAPGITVTAGGSGYTSQPSIVASGGSGSGATFTATIANGVITQIFVTNPGSGWLVGETITLAISGGGGTGATATATLMPFGIQGTGVETYAQRVWVINQDEVLFTAPASVSDFATSDGGGTFTSNDPFLRVGYRRPIQSNGFLYLLADSSINYISGVVTSGATPTTSFSNLNIDPQIGTPWPNSVQVFSRNIVFANSIGVYVSYGGAVTKISGPLDGIYNSVPNFGGFAGSAAIAEIFGIEVYILLLRIVDQVTGQPANKLLMWDGKRWWTASQEPTFQMLASQEIDSVLTAWGSDGRIIYPLFQQPSAALTKTVASKLWSTPGVYYKKTVTRLCGIANFYNADGQLNVSIDNEFGSSPTVATAAAASVTWTTSSGQVAQWTTSGGTPVRWLRAGLSVFGPQAVGQWGQLTGMTLSTAASDMALVSATMLDQEFASLW